MLIKVAVEGCTTLVADKMADDVMILTNLRGLGRGQRSFSHDLVLRSDPVAVVHQVVADGVTGADLFHEGLLLMLGVAGVRGTVYHPPDDGDSVLVDGALHLPHFRRGRPLNAARHFFQKRQQL